MAALLEPATVALAEAREVLIVSAQNRRHVHADAELKDDDALLLVRRADQDFAVARLAVRVAQPPERACEASSGRDCPVPPLWAGLPSATALSSCTGFCFTTWPTV
ncbi:hypothetical protein AURDEDRAFT_173896 [Auricularia subglabra TFB-10046 SS5]|nr:hypothetical protein AURDEDRAFT_173896 [Auricularia subglabra TFB-10046 SS5]